jgi:hypothetical protein
MNQDDTIAVKEAPVRERKKSASDNPKKDQTLKITWMVVLSLFACFMGFTILPSANEEKRAGSAPDFFTALNFQSWFNGFAQECAETNLRTGTPIGKKFLSLKAELDFTLFKKVSLENYIIGKNDAFVSEDGIYVYLGRSFAGTEAIAEKLRKVKVIQDTLKRKGIDIVLCFAPTKEYFLADEVIPDKYLTYQKQEKNDYSEYVRISRAQHLNYMDLNRIMQNFRMQYSYPLYPQYGTHWSYFAECLVADTVIKYLEMLTKRPFPHLVSNRLDYPEKPRGRDNDGSLNVYLNRESIPLAYPALDIYEPPNTPHTKVLGVADSYYRGFGYLRVTEHCFNYGDYWYYYNSVNPGPYGKNEVWEYDLKKKIEENRVIIIMDCSANLRNFGHGFIEDAYELYTDPTSYYARVQREKPLKAKMKLVHEDQELLFEAQTIARQEDIPLDSAVVKKARQLLDD